MPEIDDDRLFLERLDCAEIEVNEVDGTSPDLHCKGLNKRKGHNNNFKIDYYKITNNRGVIETKRSVSARRNNSNCVLNFTDHHNGSDFIKKAVDDVHHANPVDVITDALC